ELLASLARVAPVLPLLLVSTYRVDDATRALNGLLAAVERQSATTSIKLGHLQLSEVDTLIQLSLDLDQSAPAGLLHLVCQFSEGNPYCIEEILRSMPPGEVAALRICAFPRASRNQWSAALPIWTSSRGRGSSSLKLCNYAFACWYAFSYSPRMTSPPPE